MRTACHDVTGETGLGYVRYPFEDELTELLGREERRVDVDLVFNGNKVKVVNE